MNIDLMITAFIMGLVGGVHCIGMCGGIVGSLSMSLSTQVSPKPKALYWYVLNYNLGRISSYVFAGLIVGLISSFTLQQLPNPHEISRIISGSFSIALGLYISQIWMGLNKIEKIAMPMWKKIQPYTKNYMPPKSPLKALPLGFLWGWLPCGLVYSVLPLAYSADNPIDASLVMLSFGLATLPLLMMLGSSAMWLKQKMQNKILRMVLGILLVLWGSSQMLSINPFMNHQQHQHH